MVLASDAARTVETAKYVVAAHPNAPQVILMPQLYHAAPDTILEAIQRQTAKTIAVIGHNPGIGMLANGLVATAPKHPRFSDYPTCAATVIDFDGPIGPGLGRCVDFIVPRDLIGAAGRDAD